MARPDLRDPSRERRRIRWSFVAVAVVAALAIAAATLSAFENRPADHTYRFYATYTNTNGVPYTLLIPLPSEGLIRDAWRFLGNGTAVVDTSSYGSVLRITAHGNVTVSANVSTWRDLSASFTTEGTSAGGRPAGRAYLDATAPPAGSVLNLTLVKTDPTWTLTRALQADLFEGWNTVEVRETLARTVTLR